MLKLFIAVFAVALVYWIWRQKKQIFSHRNNKTDPTITTIKAIELQTFLDWDTPPVCLENDGRRYGEQFQDKITPDLPHGPGCRCEATQLFYTSADVFQGASTTSIHKSALGMLSPQDSLLLKQMLLKAQNASGYHDFSEFLTQFEVNNFPRSIRVKACALVERAFQQTQKREQERPMQPAPDVPENSG